MRKSDIRWRIASIIARLAYEKGYAIVLEKLDKQVAREMIERIGDKQLWHRIYKAILGGMNRAIEEKAGEHGAPVTYKPPQGTSSNCPLHDATIIYNNVSRIGRCSKRGKMAEGCCSCLEPPPQGPGRWEQCYKPLWADPRWEPHAVGLDSPHESIAIPRSLWAR